MRKYGILLMLVAVVLGGCKPPDESAGPRRVVATTMMIGDLVRQIGGEQVQLRVIMGAGVDPHTYKPSAADFEDLRNAHLVLYNGLHLEGKMVELFEEKLKDRAVAVARDIPAERLLSWKQGEAGAHDPHLWFDVSLWALAARTVGNELARVDPANAAEYQRRTGTVVASLASLHEEVAAELKKVPTDRRVLITSHDAFNYFGRAYNFDVRGLQGISTETEAGMQSIAGAVDFIVKARIPAVFVESSVSPKTIERVRDDARARGVQVTIGAELYSDAMGVPGEHPPFPVETYQGMIRYNVHSIVTALSK